MFAGPDSEDSETSFRLDGNTGEIWAAQLRSGVYRLLVAARDGSGYEAAQVARVRITVMAADPSKPYAVFVKSQYSFAVPEDAPVGTAVGTVAVSPNQQSGTCSRDNAVTQGFETPRVRGWWWCTAIEIWVGGKTGVVSRPCHVYTRV